MRKALLLLLAFLLVLPVSAAETTEGIAVPEPTPIHTPEDLQKIGENPTGSYILMNDLDMSGIPWKSLDFSGTLDGNGHAILNLTVTEPSDTKAISSDGNRKEYETVYAGFFGTLTDASISNLKLLNVQSVIECDEPVFLAGMAGYSSDSTISGCTVTGILELRAHDRIFGVGGMVGYGDGLVENCNIDVTLICTDTDAATRDEQFLGGVFATGWMDVLDTTVEIRGYASEHGYAHNGGITGMYMQFPLGANRIGTITGNHVEGFIIFFEDNTSRRAYCAAYCGEIVALNGFININTNTENFTRDERKEYDVELRPEMCENPIYTEKVLAPGCDTYGFTEYECQSCDNVYRDRYTLFSHTVTNWTVVEEATLEAEGRSSGSCDLCGAYQERVDEKLTPPPTETEPATEAATEPAPKPTAPKPEKEQEQEESKIPPILWFALGTGGVLILVLLIFRPSRSKKKGRYSGKTKGGKYLKK